MSMCARVCKQMSRRYKVFVFDQTMLSDREARAILSRRRRRRIPVTVVQ